MVKPVRVIDGDRVSVADVVVGNLPSLGDIGAHNLSEQNPDTAAATFTRIVLAALSPFTGGLCADLGRVVLV